MSAKEIGEKIAELCRQGKNIDAINQYYSPDIVSVEAVAGGMDKEMRGIDAILGKNQWWFENHEVHSGDVSGPYPHDNKFALFFSYDVTAKESGQRMKIEEVGVYTTENGKITREEFYYSM